nr:MAG TPA: hypothetical protein [Caudoviricetes sp.]
MRQKKSLCIFRGSSFACFIVKYFNKRKGSYQAFINVDKRPKYLGSYTSLEEATRVRHESEIEYGYK